MKTESSADNMPICGLPMETFVELISGAIEEMMDTTLNHVNAFVLCHKDDDKDDDNSKDLVNFIRSLAGTYLIKIIQHISVSLLDNPSNKTRLEFEKEMLDTIFNKLSESFDMASDIILSNKESLN